MSNRLFDCRKLNAKKILELLIELNPELRDIEKRRNVYVGATSNIKERIYRHHATRVIFRALTMSRNVAAAVEREAAILGFNIGKVKHGGNGTNDRSVYIYAYMMDENTVE